MADVTKRMNYFDRQFLRATDFQVEQDYHVDRRRRHNRLLHTPGVAENLNVTGTVGTNKIEVSAGTAIDPSGREIILPAQRAVLMPNGITGTVEIYIAYSEDTTDPSNDPGVDGKMRITETPIFPLRLILASSVDPEPADGVLLAKVALTNGYLDADPDNNVRKRGSIVLEDLTIRSINLKADGVAPGDWPRLSCSEANQTALEHADLRLDDQRGIFFQGDGLLSSSKDISFLTGDPGATEKMRIKDNGDISISGDLTVNGTLTGNLGSDTIGTNQIVNTAVTADKIADNAITTSKLSNGAVTSTKIAAGSVGTAEMADGAVSGAKVANSSIDTLELANKAVTNAKIADKAVSILQFKSTVVADGETSVSFNGEAAIILDQYADSHAFYMASVYVKTSSGSMTWELRSRRLEWTTYGTTTVNVAYYRELVIRNSGTAATCRYKVYRIDET